MSKFLPYPDEYIVHYDEINNNNRNFQCQKGNVLKAL